VADVAGKGVPAALLMARLHAAARFQLFTQSSAAAALTALNSEVASSGLGHRFVTFVLAIVDAQNHTITIANAGHLPPLVRSASGQVDRITRAESGMPLGITPNQTFQEFTHKMRPGDTFVLYTDGITETMNPKSEIYGSRRLAEFIASGPEKIEDLVKGIVADVEEFCAGRSQRDDMCLVGLRRVK
jgi:serine phosphatase RsbU (regulator of sigma subunit)